MIDGRAENFQIILLTHTQQSKCWDYDFELIEHVVEIYLKEMAETSELPNGTKIAMMEREKFPSCFYCWKKGHWGQTKHLQA